MGGHYGSMSHGSYTAYTGSYALSGGESGTPIAAFVTVLGDYDSSGDGRTITLDGLFLSSTAGADCVFELKAGATVNLLLKDENTLKSGWKCAGLQVPDGAEITIGVPEGEDGTVKIIGGSVLAMTKPGGDISVKAQPTNGSDSVYLAVLTLLDEEGAIASTAVTDATLSGYGVNEMVRTG